MSIQSLVLTGGIAILVVITVQITEEETNEKRCGLLNKERAYYDQYVYSYMPCPKSHINKSCSEVAVENARRNCFKCCLGTESQKSNRNSIIIGCVVGVGVLVIIALLVYLYIRKRNTNEVNTRLLDRQTNRETHLGEKETGETPPDS